MRVSVLSPSPAAVPAAPVRTVRAAAGPVVSVTPLQPAVRVEIGRPDPASGGRDPVERPRIVVDESTKSMVYQVLDPGSGEIVFQLPDPVVLKARTYAAARDRDTGTAKHTLDRTA